MESRDMCSSRAISSSVYGASWRWPRAICAMALRSRTSASWRASSDVTDAQLRTLSALAMSSAAKRHSSTRTLYCEKYLFAATQELATTKVAVCGSGTGSAVTGSNSTNMAASLRPMMEIAWSMPPPCTPV
eukprot:Amastigsp_a848185_4.p3 type:complete len:131 gc:universal Amastigsp_a848185_4:786-394(-)